MNRKRYGFPVYRLILHILVILILISLPEQGLALSTESFEPDMPFPQTTAVSAYMKVQPILFVPKNLVADPLYLPSIDAAMASVRAWYASQLDSSTFNYLPTQVVIGQHELSYYCPNTTVETQCIQIPGELGADSLDIYNVLWDLQEQGYPVLPNTILFVFWVGGYGYAGAVQYSSSSGFAAMGDWALDGLAGKYEAGTATSRCSDSPFASVICNKNAQIGGVAHELGHAFGLPHPVDDGTQPGDPDYWLSTIMAGGVDFPNVVLIDSPANPEKTRLRQHPFFFRFGDVSYDYWAHDFIRLLYGAGITGGCSANPPRYCPESTVTRDQMAVFLLKARYGKSYTPPAVGGSTGFADVPPDHWAAAWIKQLAAEGITGGCGGGNFCPGAAVTRDQMAVFLLKAEYGKFFTPPAVGDSTGFADVPPDHWAAAWIKRLAAEGITGGCGAGIFCPGNPVNRAEMAVFLVRTFSLP